MSLVGLGSKIPDYDGKSGSIHTFFGMMERISHVAGWTSKATLEIAKINLSGETHTFVEDHPMIRDTNEWIVLRTALGLIQNQM